MKIALIPSLLGSCALLLCSCSDLDSTASNGIHQPSSSMSGFKGDKIKASALSVSRPASSVSPLRAKAATLPRDKHGMPTYSFADRTRLVRTTAYSHMEMEPGAPGRLNAIGTTLAYGQVRSAAADWSVYPVGTRFKIKGLPYTYVVDDYGSALVGTNTIDIFHPSLALMNRWGTRPAEITVIQWGCLDRTLNILSKRTKYPHCRAMYLAAKSKAVPFSRVVSN